MEKENIAPRCKENTSRIHPTMELSIDSAQRKNNTFTSFNKTTCDRSYFLFLVRSLSVPFFMRDS